MKRADGVQVQRNLGRLAQVIWDLPDRGAVSLATYTKESSCGTLHCTLGWAATEPEFIKQGLMLFEDAVTLVEPVGKWMGEDVLAEPEEAAEALFGKRSFERLFAGAAAGTWDEMIQKEWAEWQEAKRGPMEDADLAIARCRLAAELWDAGADDGRGAWKDTGGRRMMRGWELWQGW